MKIECVGDRQPVIHISDPVMDPSNMGDDVTHTYCLRYSYREYTQIPGDWFVPAELWAFLVDGIPTEVANYHMGYATGRHYKKLHKLVDKYLENNFCESCVNQMEL